MRRRLNDHKIKMMRGNKVKKKKKLASRNVFNATFSAFNANKTQAIAEAMSSVRYYIMFQRKTVYDKSNIIF